MAAERCAVAVVGGGHNGLVAAAYCARAGLRCTEVYPDFDLRLVDDAAIMAFRLVQESLVNVVKHARANAAGAFKGHRLRPGAAVSVEVTASEDVGYVETFRIRSRSAPVVATACLPPGARKPVSCA